MESASSEEKLKFGNSTLPPTKNTERGGAERKRFETVELCDSLKEKDKKKNIGRCALTC